MVKIKEKNKQIEEFQKAANSLLELLQSGEQITGTQENIIVDTVNALQLSYGQWLNHQPLKGQSFPPDGNN